MTAIHLMTSGMTSEWTTRTIETTLTRVTGVAKVAVVRSAGLVSVLFDERRSTTEQILRAMRAAGIDARLSRSGQC